MKPQKSLIVFTSLALVVGFFLGMFFGDTAGAYSLKGKGKKTQTDQWYDFQARCMAKGTDYWAEGNPNDFNTWKCVDHKKSNKELQESNL
jgi:hypothetical protein